MSNSVRQIASAFLAIAIFAQVSFAQTAKPKSVTLQGRIEEIVSSGGSTLPVRLRKQSPKLDTSGALTGAAAVRSSAALSGQAAAANFPVDWRGAWGGTLKVHSVQFSPAYIRSDPEAGQREQQLLKSGSEGTVNFEFVQSGSSVSLKPAQVILKAPLKDSRYGSMIGAMYKDNPNLAPLASMMSQASYYFAIVLGDLSGGVGVSGNALQNSVVKNSVTALRPNVLEQDIVCYTTERNAQTGKTRNFYGEDVLRFTRLSADSIYVQAVIGSYGQQGERQRLVTLYGTVRKGQTAGFPGGSNPLGLPFPLQ
jgi:hypothetical protein